MAAKTSSKSKEIKDKDPVQKGKDLALKTAIDQIEKNFGKGSIMKLGGSVGERSIPVIPTGCIALDIALGAGGVPRGRIVEIFGPESSGKTTLVQHIIAETQKLGGTAALIDAENAFDPSYAEKTGVDVENLLVSQPDTGEQALDIAETLIRSNAVDLVAIDSVAALVPRAEIEGDIGDSHVAMQARLMSQALRRLSGAISRSKCTVIFTNQLRSMIGVMFGNPETTAGGKALKYYASVRIDIRKIGSLKKGDEFYGIRARAKVVKNKVAPPFRSAEFDILFNEGISKEGNLIDVGVDLDIIKKSGSWFEYDGEKIGQGKDAVRQYLKENPKISADIEKGIRTAVRQKSEIPLNIGTEETEKTSSQDTSE
ncbi:recombinase RecA [Patescibacteria group bacterium]|nr:recombinase RecA [Patescibacteria group bacterium]